MRDVLEPMFGEGGALVAQFIITLLVVLALIAVVVWLVTRYGGSKVIGQNRTPRAPRLALVDALPIDGRRRLVLVRRDNVEHLLLIGGPADVVVEPAINRAIPAGARPKPAQPQPQAQAHGQAQPRPQAQGPTPQPAAQQLQPAAAPPAPPPPAPAPVPRRMESNGGSEPIPFPQPPRPQAPPPRQSRVEPAPVETDDGVVIEPMRRSLSPVQASGHFAETARPTRIESVFSLAGALDEIAEEPEEELAISERQQAAPQPAALHHKVEIAAAEFPMPAEEPAPPTALTEAEEAPPPEPGSEAARVSDLEREMARLLGEITGKRNG
jgi:flagellar biogenesis protein FliO